MTRFVDLSHLTGMARPREGSSHHGVTRLHSARLHYPGAPDVSQVPLHTLARVPGVLMPAPVTGRHAVDVLLPAGAVGGKAVLIGTGSRPAGARVASLSRRTAEALIDGEAALLGVDFGLGEGGAAGSAVLALLLGCEIPVVEHLRGLDRLPASGFWFSAVPAAAPGAPTVPVRAFAELPGP